MNRNFGPHFPFTINACGNQHSRWEANEMAIVIPMVVLMSIDAINVMAAVEIKIKLLFRCNFIEHRKFNALYFS